MCYNLHWYLANDPKKDLSMELTLQSTFPSQANKICLQREENERPLQTSRAPRRKPAQRLRWEEEEQGSERSFRNQP